MLASVDFGSESDTTYDDGRLSTPTLTDERVSIVPVDFLHCSDEVLDTPIYRIERLPVFWRLLQGKWCLSSPRRWDDKWEAQFTKSSAAWSLSRRVFIGNQIKRPTFATCWSILEDSDTLWRAYSWVWLDEARRNRYPESEGVRLRTTPRRLMDAIVAELPQHSHMFLAKVNYRSEADLLQVVADYVGQHRGHFADDTRARDWVNRPSELAQFLCWKRVAFEHEHEFRLIVVGPEAESFSDRLDIKVDPNQLIGEVTFDPRLAQDFADRPAKARELGYQGPFGQSPLRQGALQEICLWGASAANGEVTPRPPEAL